MFPSATPDCLGVHYLGIVSHNSGSHKHAIHKMTAAGKRALCAMQYRCSVLGIDDINLQCSLSSLLVQPVQSVGVNYGV